MRQLRAFSARRGFRSQVAASSALQRGGGSSTVQVIPIITIRFAIWLDCTNVGITPTCTSYLGAESWASRRRGHHAYADGPDVYKRCHALRWRRGRRRSRVVTPSWASRLRRRARGNYPMVYFIIVISATAVPVDTTIVITYRC